MVLAMKVWLLQRSEPTPHDNSGKQRLMRMGILAQVLAAKGWEVLWWTSTFDHYNRKHRYKSDIRVMVDTGFEIQYLHGCGYTRNISIARLRDNVLVAKRFSHLAKQESTLPDVVIASMPTIELALAATSYANQNAIPVLIDIRDLWPDVFLDLAPPALGQIIKLLSIPMRNRLKKACRNATGIIGLTDVFVDWGVMHAERSRGPFDRVFPMGYMPESVYVDAKEVEDAKQFWREWGVIKENYTLIVTFFGTLGRTNDLMPVIQAAEILQQKMSPILFVIGGAGENEDSLRQQGGHLKNLIFPGWVNATQIRTLLNMADVGIAPYITSQNYIHNIPNKPAEYLSGGLAIALSLDHGALYDTLIRRGCGFSYKNDAELLASELESLANSPERLCRIQENALETFRDSFDGNVVYTEMAEFLKQLVANPNIV